MCNTYTMHLEWVPILSIYCVKDELHALLPCSVDTVCRTNKLYRNYQDHITRFIISFIMSEHAPTHRLADCLTSHSNMLFYNLPRCVIHLTVDIQSEFVTVRIEQTDIVT